LQKDAAVPHLAGMTWSRRDFLRLSALGLLAGTIPRSALARAGRSPFRELRRNVGLFTGRGGTIGWLVNRDGTVVVDSQFPDTARICLDGLESRGAPPPDALINSHHHGDHTGGNGVFRSAARRIVAHERAVELQRQSAAAGGTESAQAYADTTFRDDWSLDVGDERVRLKHYGPAHTGGDCTIFFEQADIVHMGDLVFNRLFPFIDRPGGASVRGWARLLDAVSAEHSRDTLYIFGHGQDGFGITGDRADIDLQRDFLIAVLDVAGRAIAAGHSRDEATRLDRLPAFPDHVAPAARLSLGAAVGVAYDELEADP
jgi:cyclase